MSNLNYTWIRLNNTKPLNYVETILTFYKIMIEEDK